MTNDQELIKKLTKEIGNKKNTELKVGKIYLSKEDVKNGFEPYKGVGNIFDVSSHNFHLVLDISESEKNKIYIEKYTNHIHDMREKIIDVLKEKGFVTINSSEYKKMEPIENYNKNTIYVYESGGKSGYFPALNKTTYAENKLNHLFRYIPCMKNGIYYTLNFMRFYIDRDANVNVIYNAYQFDVSRTFYTNQNYIVYPTRYTKHRLEEINAFVYNFFYNPEIIGLDFNSTKENPNERKEHIHNIVNEFIAFINKCDEVIKKE